MSGVEALADEIGFGTANAGMVLRSDWLAAYVAAERDRAVREALAPVRALHPSIPIRPWADDCGDEDHVHDPDDLGIADVCFTCPPTGDAYCGRCYDGDGGDPEPWPCPTIAALPDDREGGA